MTRDEYYAVCEGIPAKVKQIIPDEDGWRWVLVVRNQEVEQWASSSNMDRAGAIELADAYLKVRKAELN